MSVSSVSSASSALPILSVLPVSTNSIPQGSVGLVLLREGESSFYLKVPIDIINSLCSRPLKYLLFLGWCILGIDGVLALSSGDVGIDNMEGGLNDGGTYHYVVDADSSTLPSHAMEHSSHGVLHGLTDITSAVNLKVIRTRTNIASATTQTSNAFCCSLLACDIRCVWSGCMFSANLCWYLIVSPSVIYQ